MTQQQPEDSDDPVDALRRRLGIVQPERPRAGVVAPTTFEQRQAIYAEEMRLLHELGNDPKGQELWRQLMRRCGRSR